MYSSIYLSICMYITHCRHTLMNCLSTLSIYLECRHMLSEPISLFLPRLECVHIYTHTKTYRERESLSTHIAGLECRQLRLSHNRGVALKGRACRHTLLGLECRRQMLSESIAFFCQGFYRDYLSVHIYMHTKT